MIFTGKDLERTEQLQTDSQPVTCQSTGLGPGEWVSSNKLCWENNIYYGREVWRNFYV